MNLRPGANIRGPTGGTAAALRPLNGPWAACPETIFIGHAPCLWAHISGDDQFNQVMYPTGPVLPGGQVPAMFRTYPNL
ncbi:MAG: hypothetical protein R2911_17410 [Caldilineaceae bacterium]